MLKHANTSNRFLPMRNFRLLLLFMIMVAINISVSTSPSYATTAYATIPGPPECQFGLDMIGTKAADALQWNIC